ncbi:MAG: hypothetical protein JW797_00670 [Bradymonadales bacterium]|nr:hypothetical protein [Bradymonadales bacterium]
MAVRDRISLWAFQDGLLSVLVVGSACALGGVHAPTTVVLAGVAVLFALVVVLSRRGDANHRAPPVLVWCLTAAGIWALLQSLPLGAVVPALSGAMAQDWHTAESSPLRLGGNYPATVLMALRCLASAALLLGSYRFFHRSERVEALLLVIIGTAALLTALALVQEWLGGRTVLFFYEPRMGPVRAGLRGPFVNPDHYGAYMSLAALLTLGRSLTLAFQRVRYLYHGLFIFLFAGLLLSASWSAMLGFAAGWMLLALLWKRHRGRLRDLLGLSVPLMGLSLVLILFYFQVGLSPDLAWACRAQLETWRRVPEFWSGCLSVIWAHPVAGVGSGGLADNLTPFLSAPVVSVWFARNQVVQALVDFGLPVGLLLVFGLVISLRYLASRWHPDHLHIALPISAALGGLSILALTDFVLEVPALGIAGMLLLGALISLVHRYRPTDSDSGEPRRRWWSGKWIGDRAFVISITLLAIPLGIWAQSAMGGYDRAIERLAASIRSVDEEAEPPGDLAAAARQVLHYRPGMGRVFTWVGEGFLQAGQPDQALSWLEKAERHLPRDALTLRLLGTAALQLSRFEDAVTHLSEAMALDSGQVSTAIRDVVTYSGDIELWLTLARDDRTQDRLNQCLMDQDRHLEMLSFSARLLAVNPRSRPGLEGAALAATGLGLDELGLYYAEHLLAADEHNPVGNLVVAEQEWGQQEVDRSLERIERTAQVHPEDIRLWIALGEHLLERYGQDAPLPDYRPRVERVLSQLRLLVLSQPRYRLEFHGLAVRFYQSLENWRAVANAAAQGMEAVPEAPFFYQARADALERLGDPEGAQEVRRRGLQLGEPRIPPAPETTGTELLPETTGTTPGEEAIQDSENVEQQGTRSGGATSDGR